MTFGRETVWDYQTVAPRSVIRSIILSPAFETILGFLAFGIAYYFAFLFGRSFGPQLASPFWLPDSVLLVALLKSRRELWWLFILGILPIRLLSGEPSGLPLWFEVTAFGIDSVTVLVTASVLRWFMRNPIRFETLKDMGVFIAFAVVLIPAASAFAGAAARQMLTGADFWAAWMRWFMGDALAHSVVTPIILYWVFGAPWKAKALDVKGLGEAALLTAGLVLASYWCVMHSATIFDASFYAPVPFLFWAAVRFGMLGATGAVAIVAAFITYCALEGSGPFLNLSSTEATFTLQTYLFTRAVPLYLLAISIEERWSAERSLQESEERFRAMANSAPALLWVAGPDKLCTFVSHSLLEFTGRTLKHVLGKGWTEGVHPDDVRHCLEVYHSAFDARRRFETEYRLRRYDGEYRWVLDVGRPRFSQNEEFLGYVGSVLDITDRKNAEETNLALAHAQRLAIMGELTAAVAHELRQPAAAIMSNAEAALALLEAGTPPTDEIREIVTDIRNANARASEVLGHMQDFLRKRETGKQPLDLNTIVSDVVPFVASEARKRRIQIRTELAEGLPVVVGNRTHLQQVLLNLVVNAMNAISNPALVKRNVVIRTSKPNGDARVEVAVSDSGCGIASDNLPRLFESFFTTRSEGMGLGLSIARSIVESHGGHIWADNNPGGGATFHFTLQTAGNPRG